jgi:predicted transcriptional regulator
MKSMEAPIEGQVDLLLLTLEHIKALSSSAAVDVFGAVSITQPHSIGEIAAEVGKSPASVGEQVQKLVEVGLVIQAGTRKSRSRTESLYIRRAKVTHMSLKNQPWDAVEQYLVRYRNLLNLNERQHEAFWRAVQVDEEFSVFGRTLFGSAYVTSDQAARLRDAMEAVFQLMQSMHEPDPARRTSAHVRVAFQTTMLPTVVESKRRSDPS